MNWKTQSSIAKRCPNGYHKDPESGQCVDAQGNAYQGKQQQEITPQKEKTQEEPKSDIPVHVKPNSRKKTDEILGNMKEYVSDYYDGDDVSLESFVLKDGYYNLPKGGPVIKVTGKTKEGKDVDEIWVYDKKNQGFSRMTEKEGKEGRHRRWVESNVVSYDTDKKSTKKMEKSHGNYMDAIENFIVDDCPNGCYYNAIYDAFIDALDEDDIMDAIATLEDDGVIFYNENDEKYHVCADGVDKMKKSDLISRVKAIIDKLLDEYDPDKDIFDREDYSIWEGEDDKHVDFSFDGEIYDALVYGSFGNFETDLKNDLRNAGLDCYKKMTSIWTIYVDDYEASARKSTKKSKVKKSGIEWYEGMPLEEFFKTNANRYQGMPGIGIYDLYSIEYHGKQVGSSYIDVPEEYYQYGVARLEGDDMMGKGILYIYIEDPIAKSYVPKYLGFKDMVGKMRNTRDNSKIFKE